MEEKKMKNYTEQLKEFRDYMEACFTVLMEYGDRADNQAFYNSDFEITFRGKKAILYNGADVFTAIEEIIQGEIEESEEI
jgi:hypothetical protein